MLIGLCGGACAGKRSVTDYLIREHGFQPVPLLSQNYFARGNLNGDVSKGSLSGNGTIVKNESADVDALIDFVTRQWHRRWVMTDIRDEKTLDALLRRPFFILVSVDAPISVRWKRYCSRSPQNALTLEQFVLQNDDFLYSPTNGLARFVDHAKLRLLNSSNSLSTLHQALSALDLTNEERLRPNWDQYFMQLASLAALRSNCMKRQVGCVLVREKRVISTGYNGTPRNLRNCNEGGCPRCNSGSHAGIGLSTCLCIHAEENALLEAGRERIREGSTLYCDTCPCLTCSVKITQVGISEVVYSKSYSMDSEAAALLEEAGVRLRQFVPPRNGLVDLVSESAANEHLVQVNENGTG